MAKLLRRPTRVSCFYCNSQADPRDPRNFRCHECGCWNRYDANGEIMSDEPAMHDEKMNAKSFAKRASPRKDQLPSVYGQTLFCRTCQTNQMLIANLLSSYLPSPDDPEYAQRSELLPAYRESVEARYPPVCADCLPAVEEEIKNRDRMARTSALGGFLQTSRGKGKQRQVSVHQRERDKLERQLFAWRVRGVLWACSLLISLASYSLVLAGYSLQRLHPPLSTMLPIMVVLSIIWTAWDPTYASLRRAQIQGREMRQRGKREYNMLQILAWVSRLVAAMSITLPSHRPSWDYLHTLHDLPSTRARYYAYLSLGLELVILVRCALVLRIERPPPVHLVDQFSNRPSTHPSHLTSNPPSRSSTPATTAEPDILASLTLSNNPVLTRTSSPPGHNPIFGLPSLPTSSLANGAVDPDTSAMFVDEDDEGERDPNAMDWSPASPVKRARQESNYAVHPSSSDDATLLRPQRFFAPEKPTGLETLFAKTIKLADDAGPQQPGRQPRRLVSIKWRWKTIAIWAAAIVVPCIMAAAGWRWWETRRRLRELHSEL